jgi:hypothetical protein
VCETLSEAQHGDCEGISEITPLTRLDGHFLRRGSGPERLAPHAMAGVTVPRRVVGDSGYNRWLSGSLESPDKWGFSKSPTILGTVTWLVEPLTSNAVSWYHSVHTVRSTGDSVK